ncbi:MAG TPA: HisA/HisF-related TIM barrel protein [Thermaerobacter sp.]
MLVIPALDLRGRRLVRLWQGDYARETVYAGDPIGVARSFVAAGAPRLHVVDLDGARSGRPVHLDLILRLAASVPVPVQVGGGIRDAATAAAYLEGGVAAVIFGTAAVRHPQRVAEVAARYPGRVLVSLDLKDGRPAVEGWTGTGPGGSPLAPASLAPLLACFRQAGVMHLVVTDTRRDGTLAGVDPTVFRPFVAAGFHVIAAGGVRDAADVGRLRDAGLWGVIAGRALYEGTLDLATALAVASRSAPPETDPRPPAPAERAAEAPAHAADATRRPLAGTPPRLGAGGAGARRDRRGRAGSSERGRAGSPGEEGRPC